MAVSMRLRSNGEASATGVADPMASRMCSPQASRRPPMAVVQSVRVRVIVTFPRQGERAPAGGSVWHRQCPIASYRSWGADPTEGLRSTGEGALALEPTTDGL